MKFEVIVGPKPEVLDPEARAICATLQKHGKNFVKNLTVQKRFLIDCDDSTTETQVQQIAKDYLTNSVSESCFTRKI